MMEWLTAQTSNPNWVLVLLGLVSGLGWAALIDATHKLDQSTKKWMQVKAMYDAILGPRRN
jgi:hypothetical protein